MKYSQAQPGRVFVIRLENGETLHTEIEKFALEQKITAASLVAVGAADQGSRLIVGPENAGARPVKPMEHMLSGVHEVAGTGTLFPDEEGRPMLHMHLACGREDNTVTGCTRQGVKIWHVLEVIVFELCNCSAQRALDPETGFKLLKP